MFNNIYFLSNSKAYVYDSWIDADRFVLTSYIYWGASYSKSDIGLRN